MSKQDTTTAEAAEAAVSTVREDVFAGALTNVTLIESLTMEVFDIDAAADIDREQAAARAAEIYSVVCDHKTAEGKPAYGNDGARKAAAAALEADDEVLQVLRRSLRESARDLAVKRARLESLRTSINIARAFLQGS